jgi:transcriptional regulator with GAF, ATPase, and Fis domain
MEPELRDSGIDVVGRLPWGTHFCHFYDTKEDLLETLVPYFKAGLKRREFCFWVVSDVTKQEAIDALKRTTPDLERHFADRSMEIVSERDWYLDGGNQNLDRILRGWNEKLSDALSRGYDGMRVTGSPICLHGKNGSDLNAYEKKLDESMANLAMTCLCSYPVAACGAAEVLDVARTHQFMVARRKGAWEVLETPELRQAKSEIKRLNDDLEQRVVTRTRELTAVNEQLRNALAEIDELRQRLESENAYLRQEVREASGNHKLLGASAGLQRVLEQIEVVAPTDATVLILGETGVGKELVARAIHESGLRRDRPIVKINCTAIPRELFESEFFGHIKGAFTGASADRIGRFQLADGGTLFLDEIGDLPAAMQPKLLRVLQDGEFEAVGDNRTRRVNVRIVAATNRDLKGLVRERRFREDLYYRLSVFPIEVPPLRERKGDLPLLASHFLKVASKRFNRSGLRLSASQLRQLQTYDWPGNVRELQNVIERAVIASRLGPLRVDIPTVAESGAHASPAARFASRQESEVIPDEEMDRRVRDNMAAALKCSGGRIYGPGGAAELLGIKPSTLTTRVRKLGLK